MSFGQSVANPTDDVNRFIGREPVATNSLLQCQTVEVLHNVVELAVIGAPVVINLNGVP